MTCTTQSSPDPTCLVPEIITFFDLQKSLDFSKWRKVSFHKKNKHRQSKKCKVSMFFLIPTCVYSFLAYKATGRHAMIISLWTPFQICRRNYKLRISAISYASITKGLPYCRTESSRHQLFPFFVIRKNREHFWLTRKIK